VTKSRDISSQTAVGGEIGCKITHRVAV